MSNSPTGYIDPTGLFREDLIVGDIATWENPAARESAYQAFQLWKGGYRGEMIARLGPMPPRNLPGRPVPRALTFFNEVREVTDYLRGPGMVQLELDQWAVDRRLNARRARQGLPPVRSPSATLVVSHAGWREYQKGW